MARAGLGPIDFGRDRVGKAWTAGEREVLRALAHASLTASEVAGLLGRSAGAVQQKAIEIGITLRPTPPVRREAPRRPSPGGGRGRRPGETAISKQGKTR